MKMKKLEKLKKPGLGKFLKQKLTYGNMKNLRGGIPSGSGFNPSTGCSYHEEQTFCFHGNSVVNCQISYEECSEQQAQTQIPPNNHQ